MIYSKYLFEEYIILALHVTRLATTARGTKPDYLTLY
jgi:hypothetical protein